MALGRIRKLRLPSLAEGRLPGVSRVIGAHLAEAAAIRFEDQGHSAGVELSVDGDFEYIYEVYWVDRITDQVLRSWGDDEYTTEHAACGVALLLICDLTDYIVISRSQKRTGIDYWLGTEEENEDEPPSFENKARLEVAGIRENPGRVGTKVNEKLGRLDRFPNPLPAYVIVVEFSTPMSRVVTRI